MALELIGGLIPVQGGKAITVTTTTGQWLVVAEELKKSRYGETVSGSPALSVWRRVPTCRLITMSRTKNAWSLKEMYSLAIFWSGAVSSIWHAPAANMVKCSAIPAPCYLFTAAFVPTSLFYTKGEACVIEWRHPRMM